MFSSDNSSYPLLYHQSNAIPESNSNIFFQHYHGKLLPPTYPPISDDSLINLSSEPSIHQQNTILCPSNLLVNRVSSSRRTAGKKDRHTKISTAQGVRDRRVRLSMSIAREFFNLQDMLGFDKASKTLGWLLAKSKAAIDELASTSNFKFPTLIEDNNEDDYQDDNDDQSMVFDEKSSCKKRTRRENNLNGRNVSNKTRRREEARERARERTRKKKIVDDHNNNHHHQQQQLLESLNHLPLYHHQRIQQDLMICQSGSAATNHNAPSYGLISKEIEVSVEESVAVKGSNKSRESSYNYNYEIISSRDDQESCNYDNDCFNKSTSESFNHGGIMQPPGFPALNIINLSTEIHINARPWDTYSNQILHY